MIIAMFLANFFLSYSPDYKLKFEVKKNNKVRFVATRCAVGWLRGSVGASSFWLGGFGWFLLAEDNFGWFQVVCCTLLVVAPISQHTKELTLYYTLGRT